MPSTATTLDWTTLDESVGWLAAAIYALAVGSYGTTIKIATRRRQDVHPLVLQTYKIAVFFVVCCITTPLMGETISYTPWGLLSGLLYTIGSCFGIVAIRACGVSSATGTWTSCIILMNFFWGILVFREQVKSFENAVAAFTLLLLGLVGMSRYSNAGSNSDNDVSSATSNGNDPSTKGGTITLLLKDVGNIELSTSVFSPSKVRKRPERSDSQDDEEEDGDNEHESFLSGPRPSTKAVAPKKHLGLRQPVLSTRQWGLLASVVTGVSLGSMLIPMHYAKRQGYSKAGYLVSFGSGSMLITLLAWGLLYCYRLKQSSWSFGETSLPPLYIKELWIVGAMSGILISTGIIASIVSVSILGQATGNSLNQSKLLITGLWGIYFGEFSNRDAIMKWFMSAAITIIGILMLSYEHQSSSKEQL